MTLYKKDDTIIFVIVVRHIESMNDKLNSYSSIVNSLIEKTRASNQAAFEELLDLYEPLFKSLLTRYYSNNPNAQDAEDLKQELTIAFFNSILSFDMEQKEVSFGLWAKICMNNALYTQLRALKKRNENAMVAFDSEDIDLGACGEEKSPENELVEKESLRELKTRIEDVLSPFENKVWRLYVVGCTTREMAQTLNKSEKSIDNAIFRMRRKLARSLFQK